MLVSSTFSTVSSHKPTSAQLLLRGTRNGDLPATLSIPPSTSTAISRLERSPLFSWPQLQSIISTGSLHLLSRHPDDLRDYFAWMDSVKSTYGSVQAFLLAERFTATKLLGKASPTSKCFPQQSVEKCFRSAFILGEDCQVLVNDWPYSVPKDVTHYVVWSYVPILHPTLVDQSADETLGELAWNIISKRGLCGTISPTTGAAIPTLQNHTIQLPDLIPTIASLSMEGRKELGRMLERACGDLIEFIKLHWDMEGCEAAFFANPPSLQSVPSLAHFHVLIKST